jgi:membrane complex biogenesis BtpA family protein
MSKLRKIFSTNIPVIGMIHLPPLVGYKEHPGMDKVIKYAIRELKSLEAGGVNGVMVENENDHPHQVAVGPEIISAMTKIVDEIVKKSSIPVGLEVLLNDPKASLAIAMVTGAKFIRTDYFVDRMVREEYGGEMLIDPKGLMVYKKKIGAEHVLVFTDIQVKYATLLEENKTITQSANLAIESGSDGLVVTGNFTGTEPELDDLREAKLATGSFPVLVGSGFSKENAGKLLKYASGAIVGTSLKKGNYISQYKVKDLMSKVYEIRGDNES